MTRPPRLLLGVALALATACAGAPGSASPSSSRGDPKTVTEGDLAQAVQLNLYDYLAAERPRWLRGSVPVRAGAPDVVVFLNDTRLGGVQSLKTISINTVRTARYYEASAAQQKFPGRDIGAVIQVVVK